MNWLFAILAALSFGVALAGGNLSAVSSAVLSEGYSAVKLCLELCGTVAMWSGIMNIAEEAGLCRALSAAMSPITDRLFPGLRQKSPRAMSSISLNITANLLGLGSAATPMALEAMGELDRLNGGGKRASDYMVVFVVLNTASFQILPTTVASIRRLAGSPSPLDILPAVWLCSALSVTAAVGTALALKGLAGDKR